VKRRKRGATSSSRVGFKSSCRAGGAQLAPLRLQCEVMTALDKLSRPQLEDLAAKLRHEIARNPENTRMEQLELEDVKQWIAIHHDREQLESEP